MILTVCCVVSLCYTNKAGAAHSGYLSPWWLPVRTLKVPMILEFQRSNVRRSAPSGGFQEVQLSVFYNMKHHSSDSMFIHPENKDKMQNHMSSIGGAVSRGLNQNAYFVYFSNVSSQLSKYANDWLAALFICLFTPVTGVLTGHQCH